MDEQNEQRSDQLDLLGRLSSPELVVLNQRWAGQTSTEIGSALGISQAGARDHLGNIYDKLGVTYSDGAASHDTIMSFSSISEDPEAPIIPTPEEVPQEELASPTQPSAQALALVEADDQLLLSQGTTQSVVAAPPPSRPMWIYIAAATAGILVIALLLIVLLNDDDDDEEMARSETATAFTQELDSTATALAGLATLDRQDLDATATELSSIATQTQESADTEATAQAEAATQTQEAADAAATESANATASAQPTETPEPTATPEPTETPEPTATPEPEEPTPTEDGDSGDATPTEDGGGEPPAPAPGNQVYDADLNGNPDEWQLDDNWTIDGGTLQSANNGRRTLLAPDAATENATANYAVEVVMTITELDGCNGVAGPLARGAEQNVDDNQFVSGYMGVHCRDGWRILVVPDDSQDAQELQSGEAQIDDQPHTYRLEVNGSTIRLFRDGEFVGEATDDRFQDTGNVGIYLDGDVNIQATNFRVFALDGS